jgi:hypothetical protein
MAPKIYQLSGVAEKSSVIDHPSPVQADQASPEVINHPLPVQTDQLKV